MSLARFPDNQEIRKNFERALKEARQGIISTDNGFDSITDRALIAVANSYPSIDETLVKKARQELEWQLDGTHAEYRRQETVAYLRKRGIRR